MDNKQKVYQFIHSQTHAVVGTISQGNKPEGAWVGFGEKEDLTIIFGTDTNTRKYKNILQNPHVCLTISNETTSVQYEGVAAVLEGEDLESLKNLYFDKIPTAKKYTNGPNQIYLKITPKWIRYVKHGNSSEEFEITL